MREIRLFPAAERDLEDIWDYSARTWSVSQAEAYHASIVRAFHELGMAQKRGRPTGVRPGTMKYPVDSHVIYFRESAGRIEIVWILNKRQDVETNL